MIWKWVLRRIMTFIRRPASVGIWYIHWTFNKNKKQKIKQAKRNLMSALAFRDVPDGISEARSMIVCFYIWNLTWINIWRIEETIVIIVIIIYLLTLYGILRCAAMILYANLAFFCIDRFVPTVASLFWCVFVYIYIFYLFGVYRIY